MPGKYDASTRVKAIRLVREHAGDYPTEWAAITAVSGRLGMSAETLRKWIRQAEVDAGEKPGTTRRNPTINPFINPDGEKNLFNSRQPADDVANYLGPWSKILENAGGYSPEEARAAALRALPDLLHFDRTKPATYPNGRVLTDDVYSIRFAWLSNGKIPPAGLKPHDDLLNEFPYLGVPTP